MKVGDYLAAANALPLASLQQITRGRALILAPHPDDESLGCGGLIAEACCQGEPPIVAVLTDGAGSHPQSRSFPPDRLRDLREAETSAALTQLGLQTEHIVFLRAPDTAAPHQGPEFDRLVTLVCELVRRHGCGAILATWRFDPHCDHVAAHRIAEAAAVDTGVVHWAYPVWGLTLPPDGYLPGTPSGLRLDVSRHVASKRQAILSHRSQYAGLIEDDPSGFQMEPAFMALFQTPVELYLDPDE